MKLKKVTASSFGPLKDWKSPEIGENFVVVYGCNESGKTTLFRLVSTLLYGFNPVTDNPYIPWDGSVVECSGTFADDSGHYMDIYRRLKNRPEGSVLFEGKKENLANKPVSKAAHVPWDIFNEVFSLTIDELCFPEGTLWQGIQDQLLGGQYVKLFHPVSRVASEIREEAGSLWRPNRLGNPKDKQLSAAYGELKDRLNKAMENEKCLRKIEEEIHDINTHINSLLVEKSGIMKGLNRYERLYPVFKSLKKIEQLKKLAGDVAQYDFLPEDVEGALYGINNDRENLKKQYEGLNIKIDEARKKTSLYTPTHRAVYEHRDDIERLSRSYAQTESDLNAIEGYNIEIAGLFERQKILAADLIEGSLNEKTAQYLSDFDSSKLRHAIQSYKSENAKYQEQQTYVSGLRIKASSGKIHKFVPWASIGMMIGGLAGMMLTDSPFESTVSGVLTISGAVLMIIYALLGRNRNDSELKEGEKKLAKLLYARNEAKERVRECLKDLNIREDRLLEPDEMLISDVAALKDTCCSMQKVADMRSTAEGRISNVRLLSSAIMMECGIPEGKDILENISTLEKLLVEARTFRQEAEKANTEIGSCGRTLSEIDGKIKEAEKKYKSLIDGLMSIKGDSLEEKIQCLKERRRHNEMSMSIMEELEREHPDLDDLVFEIESEDMQDSRWLFDDGYVVKLRMELQEIENKINALNESVGSLKKDMEHRREMESPDEIRSRMMEIEDLRRQASEERDRLMLLRNIILKAESIYREENQPDVLKKAGKYLKAITGGRYFDFYGEEGDKALDVMSNYRKQPLNTEKMTLSRGTKEQIYLALRLSLANHLDSSGERLPLFLDEVFINWDENRMDNAAALFNEIKYERQVFLFTCHRDLANMFSSKCGAQVIEMKGDTPSQFAQ